jgi:ABC-type microcin C transport system duplicated ATPase subunit YejF
VVHEVANLLAAKDLNFSYRTSVPILKEINVHVSEGSNVGLVGESGSGKSTLLRLLLGILSPTAGEILFEGNKLELSDKVQARKFRSQVQVVFQDPYSSLDPRQRIDRLIAEPLISLGLSKQVSTEKRLQSAWVEEQVIGALESVGLSADLAKRYPDEFSGGQRQRIAIARAIVCKPRILLADEPVSALDVTTRVHIIELLRDLGERNNLTIVTVSHDLAVVASLCKETIVLEKGVVVEQGLTAQVLGEPSHPYTKKLIESLPRLKV